MAAKLQFFEHALKIARAHTHIHTQTHHSFFMRDGPRRHQPMAVADIRRSNKAAAIRSRAAGICSRPTRSRTNRPTVHGARRCVDSEITFRQLFCNFRKKLRWTDDPSERVGRASVAVSDRSFTFGAIVRPDVSGTPYRQNLSCEVW